MQTRNLTHYIIVSLLLISNLFLVLQLVFIYNQQQILKERTKIMEDGYQEITSNYLNQIKNSNNEIIKNQGKIEGIMAVIFNVKPNENDYSKIWHAGYNAGSEVADFTEYSAYESGYMSACQDYQIPVPLVPHPIPEKKQ